MTVGVLLIHFVYTFELRTKDEKFLRFEDAKNANNTTIKIYDILKKKRKVYCNLSRTLL